VDNFNQDDFGFGDIINIHLETAEEATARNAGKHFEALADNLKNRQQAVMQSFYGANSTASGPMGHCGFQGFTAPTDDGCVAGQAMNRLKSTGPLGRRFGIRNFGFGSLNCSLTPNSNAFSVSDLTMRLYGTPGIVVLSIQQEPNCWRSFTDHGNVVHQLKPDLYAATSDGKYEDHWFFEYDTGKEPASRIMRQCKLYEDYYNTNMEQRDTGAFPVVVWIVPDEKRKDSLLSGINQSAEIRHKELFLFILPGELETLIRNGAGI